jgi:hypothetical protein
MPKLTALAGKMIDLNRKSVLALEALSKFSNLVILRMLTLSCCISGIFLN